MPSTTAVERSLAELCHRQLRKEFLPLAKQGRSTPACSSRRSEYPAELVTLTANTLPYILPCMSVDQRVIAVLPGIGAGMAAFIGVEIAGLALSVAVRLVEQHTKWFYLGEEWNTWLGVAPLLGYAPGGLPRPDCLRPDD